MVGSQQFDQQALVTVPTGLEDGSDEQKICEIVGHV
jgi:hypothetical protein